MSRLARFLLVGGLAIAVVFLLAAAITVAAPYLAVIIIIWIVCALYGPSAHPTDETTDNEKPPA